MSEVQTDILRTERLGITVSTVALCLALSIFVPLPLVGYSLTVLGVELWLQPPAPLPYVAITLALVCAGVSSVMRALPQVRARPPTYTVALWSLPVLVAFLGLTLLHRLSWWGYQLGLVGVTALILALVIALLGRSVSVSPAERRAARSLLNAIVYAMALVSFIALHSSRLHIALHFLGVLVLSSLLSLEMFRDTELGMARVWLYAGLVGLLMGELIWPLSFLPLGDRLAGSSLLLAFYLLTGVVQQYLWGRLSRRVAIEYGAVGVLGTAVLVWLS